MKYFTVTIIVLFCIQYRMCRDEDKIMKACYWPNEIFEPCFGGCAEVSCDNPRSHLRPCYPYCEPGCVCEDPYVRDDRTHQCVLPQDCSPTLMGIPVPTRKSDKQPQTNRYSGRMTRSHSELPVDFADNENIMSGNSMMPVNINMPPNHVPSNNMIPANNPISFKNANLKEDKRGADVSRMGNYFNIVIAPPPIKALQPRKLIQSDNYRSSAKRMS